MRVKKLLQGVGSCDDESWCVSRNSEDDCRKSRRNKIIRMKTLNEKTYAQSPREQTMRLVLERGAAQLENKKGFQRVSMTPSSAAFTSRVTTTDVKQRLHVNKEEEKTLPKRQFNLQLSLLNRWEPHKKNHIRHLAPVTSHRQSSPIDETIKTERCRRKGRDLDAKFSQGIQLIDYKNYGGPFNVRHIPEGDENIKIDESEVNIINEIAQIDEKVQDEEKEKDEENVGQQKIYFKEMKHKLIKDPKDYFAQYKKINSILDAESFFEGEKITSYSPMLASTQRNNLLPKKLRLLDTIYNPEDSLPQTARSTFQKSQINVGSIKQLMELPGGEEKSERGTIALAKLIQKRVVGGGVTSTQANVSPYIRSMQRKFEGMSFLKQKKSDLEGISSIIKERDIIQKRDQNALHEEEVRRSKQEELNLDNFSINDKYAHIVSAGVSELMKKCTSIKLGKNRLTDQGVAQIIRSIPGHVQSLDLSYNIFNGLGLRPLVERIQQASLLALIEINLEGNLLGDVSIMQFLYALQETSKVRILNLAKNGLTRTSLPALVSFLLNRSHINELYLGWNYFKADSGTIIAQTLLENESLKVIDLSYNSIGVSDSQNCPKMFAKLFQNNSNYSEIVHIDLSYNQFDQTAASILSAGLALNSKILGFHFQGNHGFVDHHGFLITTPSLPNLTHPLASHIQGVKKTALSQQKVTGLMDNCWICEGWEQRKYMWRPPISGNVKEDPIYICISFDNYQPRRMERHEVGNLVEFVYSTMCPPHSKVIYFFIANGQYVYAKEQQHEDVNLTEISLFYSNSVIVHIPLLRTANTFQTGSSSLFPNDSSYITTITCPPRKEIQLYSEPKERPLTLVWNKSLSVFSEYQNQLDVSLLDAQFEFDWKNGLLEQIITQDAPSFKKLLRYYYKQIADLYKYYSSFKPSFSDCWSIPIEVFLQLLNSGPINLIDEKSLKSCSISLLFDQVNISEKRNPNSHLYNTFLRIAEIKYIHTGVTFDQSESLSLLFERGFQALCDVVSCQQEWRTTNIWNQDVDRIILYYKPLANYIFNKYSSRQTTEQMVNGGDSLNGMNLKQFKTFVNENLSEDSLLSVVDIQKCFNLSVQSQVDEITRSRHQYLNLIEFYESLCRLANLLIIPPIGYNNLEDSQVLSFKDIPLYIKLEAMFVKIFQHHQNESHLSDEIVVSPQSLFEDQIKQYIFSKQINIFKDSSILEKNGNRCLQANDLDLNLKDRRVRNSKEDSADLIGFQQLNDEKIVTNKKNQLELKYNLQPKMRIQNEKTQSTYPSSQPKISSQILSLNYERRTKMMPKRQPSVGVPTPIEFAEQSFPKSNQEILNANGDSITFDPETNVLKKGRVIRRSNSFFNKTTSFLFKDSNDRSSTPSLSKLKEKKLIRKTNLYHS